MRRFLVLLVFVTLFFVLSCAEKEEFKTKNAFTSEIPPVKVIAKTDRTKATVSQFIIFTISVEYASEIKVNIPEAGAKVAGLRITDFGEKGPLKRDGRLLHEKWFKLQPDIVGTYIIPSMIVSYIPNELHTAAKKAGFGKFSLRFLILKLQKIPVNYLFTENEKLVDKNIHIEFDELKNIWQKNR